MTIACLILACSTSAHGQVAGREHSASRQVHAFADAWNRHDMHALGQLFAADADFVNVTAAWWKGRTAIEKNHAFLHGTVKPTDTAGVSGSPLRNYGAFRLTSLDFDSVEVRIVGNSVAIARAAWQIRGDPRAATARKGLFMFVLHDDRGAWRIVAAQNTESNRPQGLSR